MKEPNIEQLFKEKDPEVAGYLARHAKTPGSLLRIFQRLELEPPRDMDAARAGLAAYLNQHGLKEFKARMGMMRESDQEAAEPRVPTPLPESEPFSIFGPRRQSSSIFRALPPDGGRPKSSDGPSFENQQTMGGTSIPAILSGIPLECLTPEGLLAARQGKNPFGEAPLIDRRSGVDRRSGRDRRQADQLVFRNSRYTEGRRLNSERRQNPPPPRPLEVDPEAVTGNKALKAAGWKPPVPKASPGEGQK